MSKLLADADICVKCGLCLSTCPTYTKTQHENESPRGRIALIQSYESGQLSDSKAVRAHIDNCLLCRKCERVCQALVRYSHLIDTFLILLVRSFRQTLKHLSPCRYSKKWHMIKLRNT